MPRTLWVNGKLAYIPKSQLCFVYRFTKDGENFRKKIYQPYSESYKWRGNVSQKHTEGIRSLSMHSNIVLITSSRKDRICLSKLFSDVINTQNEHEKAITPEVDEFLNKNYDAKFVWWNNDKTGKEQNMKLNSKGYGWINCPNIYEAKDPSDLIAKLGIEKGYKILEEELRKKNIIQ